MNKKTLLSLSNISKSFDENLVLDRVNISIKEEEIHAIIGANGAGKSTLMKIINGVLKYDKGEIFLYGKPQKYSNSQDALRCGIAMVYQDFSLISSLRVYQNIFLSHNPYKRFTFIDDKKSIKKSKELLLSITDAIDINPIAFVGDLSIGKQQIVEIAKALSTNPKILILDEPTASLTASEKLSLFKVMRNLKVKGISIIFITHYLKDIFEICDTATVLRDGNIIYTKAIENLTLEKITKDMLNNDFENKNITFVSESKHNKKNENNHPYLELRNIETNDITASLKAYKGEIIGIVGLLGSGRTELLESIFGLARINKGKIFLDNKEIKINSVQDAIKAGICLVPEDRHKQGLILGFTVKQNIVLASLRDLIVHILLDKKKEEKISNHLIKQLQIKTTGNEQQVQFLSGGNQQKVVFAKSLLLNAKVLLLDDPTVGVDVHAKKEIFNLVKDFAKNKVVILVSSELKELLDNCDRMYIMKKHTITEEINGIKNDLTEEKLLLYAQ